MVHVWRRPMAVDYFLARVAERSYAYERENAKRLLEDQTEKIKVSGGTLTKSHFREGRPAEEIVRLAEELSVGLVVIGSRGLGPVKRLVTGSVSEGVVHLAPCPTLVVRGGEGIWPTSRLIVGDDASEEARRAGELAAGIGKLFDARALLVRVYPQVTVFKARRVSHVQASRELLKKGERSLEKRAAELESILGTRPEVWVASGDATAVLQEASEAGGEPALVAVGSRGLGDVQHFALGSVSTGVLRAVSGPVLIVPSPGS